MIFYFLTVYSITNGAQYKGCIVVFKHSNSKSQCIADFHAVYSKCTRALIALPVGELEMA